MCAEGRALETPQHTGVPTLQPWLPQGPAQLRFVWLPDPMQTSKARERSLQDSISHLPPFHP